MASLPPQVLVDTAYETKRMRSVLADNMAARMSLESQRREEIIVYNREQREKAATQKAKVCTGGNVGNMRPRAGRGAQPRRPTSGERFGESRLRQASFACYTTLRPSCVCSFTLTIRVRG